MSSFYLPTYPVKSHRGFVFFTFDFFNLETHVSLRRYFRILYYISGAKSNQNFCKAVFPVLDLYS